MKRIIIQILCVLLWTAVGYIGAALIADSLFFAFILSQRLGRDLFPGGLNPPLFYGMVLGPAILAAAAFLLGLMGFLPGTRIQRGCRPQWTAPGALFLKLICLCTWTGLSLVGAAFIGGLVAVALAGAEGGSKGTMVEAVATVGPPLVASGVAAAGVLGFLPGTAVEVWKKKLAAPSTGKARQ